MISIVTASEMENQAQVENLAVTGQRCSVKAGGIWLRR